MERAQRLYDCITGMEDRYLEDARLFLAAAPPAPSGRIWRRWGALAAALILVLGLGRIAGGMFRMGSSAPSTPSAAPSETPAASAPAASAPEEPPAVPEAPSNVSGQAPSSSGGPEATAPPPDPGQNDGSAFRSYGEMAASPDTALVAEASVSAARTEGPYTRLTLELIDVLKGDARPGETVTLLTSQPFAEGERAVWFLPQPGEDPVGLERAFALADGDQVLVWSDMLHGEGDGQVWMETEDFKALIRQAVE